MKRDTTDALHGLLGPLYQDYAYGYPHKSAYRAFDPPIRLQDAWAEEDLDRLFLYVHLPFCEMRCGFCNLFTRANPNQSLVSRYLAAVGREMRETSAILGPVRISRVALGGGTPTFLSGKELELLFNSLVDTLGADLQATPMAIETSPKTVSADKLRLLHQFGVDRISMGVQSFFEAEARAMGRPQATADVVQALDTLRQFDWGCLNLDFIYGAKNQTVASWVESLKMAMRWHPEEVYLYPLYIRTRTGLDGKASVEDEHRRSLYRAGRDFLIDQGYQQTSMRAFRRSDGHLDGAPEYVCQEDGMLGLGAGARSYTRTVHYSSEYAVSRPGVTGIIESYSDRTPESFHWIRHGITVSDMERSKRYVLKSILNTKGLDENRYRQIFRDSPAEHHPEISTLLTSGLLEIRDNIIAPTSLGLEYSDAIPPLFYSDSIRQRMTNSAVA